MRTFKVNVPVTAIMNVTLIAKDETQAQLLFDAGEYSGISFDLQSVEIASNIGDSLDMFEIVEDDTFN